MRRLAVIAVLLILLPGAAAAARMPGRFVRVEGVSVGGIINKANEEAKTFNRPFALSGRLAKVTCALGRFRFGLAYLDAYGQFMGEWGEQMSLPVHVGYTIWSNPRKTWLVYGAAPEVYVEASATPWTHRFRSDPGGRVSLCVDADYWGAGGQFECGWLFGRNSLYAGLRLRLLAFGVGF